MTVFAHKIASPFLYTAVSSLFLLSLLWMNPTNCSEIAFVYFVFKIIMALSTWDIVLARYKTERHCEVMRK